MFHRRGNRGRGAARCPSPPGWREAGLGRHVGSRPPALAPPSPLQTAPRARALLISNSCHLRLAKAHQPKLLQIDYSETHPFPGTDLGGELRTEGKKRKKRRVRPWQAWAPAEPHVGRSWWSRCSEQGLPAHLREVCTGQLPWAGSRPGSPGARTGLHVLSGLRPLDPPPWPFPERRQWAGGWPGRLLSGSSGVSRARRLLWLQSRKEYSEEPRG